ncbi:PTS glucose transporter subunit IIBC [Macrococcus hajekii]|uniref:PTS glucose transporter subunit IIBC n=1 Tax=Macrococcus hajekii TaxID=198482 RepID=A0A4R6BNB9_9STAP|nr:N-acetylglucosamine-specific PTS transporter subunit IIBC [Macrococcus hajekii]TDM03202.1 PTS glucose transporter subunit IIBC [Macrococcus hajekii]GGA96833.1 PTS glucose transporter subunit IIBC [Macrococcus hajekii]
MLSFFQRLGRSLMLPVAILPAAAIIVGIGNTIEAFAGEKTIISQFFSTAGLSILTLMGLLFAIGTALGMAKKNDGAAALAAVVGFFMVTTILKPENVSIFLNTPVDKINPGFAKIDNSNVFVGIVIGLIAAYMYNKFSETELPMALSFFSGKRLVPIMTAFSAMFIALILLFIWPAIFSALITFGEWILGMGPLGAGLYGFFNRLLIPLGLHHALNAVFWFDIANVNDIINFQQGTGTQGITGRYMAGFFPVMMFGMPAAALAMYHTAKTEQKKRVAGLMLAGSVSAFFVGITEPIEFAFMFVAPGLFLIHAVLTGLSLFIAALFQWTAGFAFSAGLIDFSLSLLNPMANHPMMLIVQGLIFFVLYYVIFRAAIQMFDMKTPGRGDDVMAVAEDETVPATGGKYSAMAHSMIDGLGGSANIVSLTNCATRLRLEVKDNTLIDDAKLKQGGAVGVTKSGRTQAQVIIGTHVQQVADEVEKQLEY